MIKIGSGYPHGHAHVCVFVCACVCIGWSVRRKVKEKAGMRAVWDKSTGTNLTQGGSGPGQAGCTLPFVLKLPSLS